MTAHPPSNPPVAELAADWWSTEIIDIAPGSIRMRGYAIEDLIGTVGFAEMIWLMLRGELPSAGEAELLTAALVAGVDHGPHAPSIATARMAATCGIGLNGAMASAINVLGDVHGGAGQQCMELYASIDTRSAAGPSLEEAATAAIGERITLKAHVPGFGHRFHPVDPRAGRLLDLVASSAAAGIVSGRYAEIGRAVERALAAAKGKLLPMNIDGATAVVFSELGFPSALGRGLFVLSRSVGILAHAWEQTLQGGRIKGPMPPALAYRYNGKTARNLKKDRP